MKWNRKLVEKHRFNVVDGVLYSTWSKDETIRYVQLTMVIRFGLFVLWEQVEEELWKGGYCGFLNWKSIVEIIVCSTTRRSNKL